MIDSVFQRRTTGSVLCPSCGSLVGVRDDKCYTCGRARPGLWGFAPVVRQLGADFGLVPVVIGGSTVMFGVAPLLTPMLGADILRGRRGLLFFLPRRTALFV